MLCTNHSVRAINKCLTYWPCSITPIENDVCIIIEVHRRSVVVHRCGVAS